MNRFFYLFIALLFATMVNAQVGIGTATPKASAALDITSTTQGFLPPRMNSAERDLIPSPDAGLTIYNTTTQAIEFWNGSGWISTIYTTPTPVTHFIGESYGGGIVFYVTPNALHGLIAETQDLLFSSWFDAHDFMSGSVGHSAAGQNYTDWRVPTKSELNKLYLQKNVVGGFGTGSYWSSNEVDYMQAWYQHMGSGVQSIDVKTSFYIVRPVRAF